MRCPCLPCVAMNINTGHDAVLRLACKAAFYFSRPQSLSGEQTCTVCGQSAAFPTAREMHAITLGLPSSKKTSLPDLGLLRASFRSDSLAWTQWPRSSSRRSATIRTTSTSRSTVAGSWKTCRPVAPLFPSSDSSQSPLTCSSVSGCVERLLWVLIPL